MFTAALFVFALSAVATAQESDPAEIKRRILERVREKLSSERAAMLKRVEKIVDEELSKPAASGALPADLDKQVKEIERRMRMLEDQREALANEAARLKREAADEPLKKEAAKDVPDDPDQVKALFDGAIAQHEKKQFADSIKTFKKIYYRYPDTLIGATSAYNVACGFALWGKKEDALDWLEVAVRRGFGKFDHLREDLDLESLRNEKRYKKLLLDK